MKNLFASSALAIVALSSLLLGWSTAPASAARSQDELKQIAAKLAGELARACPHGPSGDAAAFQKCASALSQANEIPFAPGVLWGGDQANLRIKNRKLTRVSADAYRSTYLPLLTFTGQFSVARDEREKVDIVQIEAYFRNTLPAGDYPYPFWHSAEKWEAHEAMNRISFYLDDKGRITVITRSADGSDQNRGEYSRVTPPAFVKDQWTWTDASGQQQPRVMQFSSRYQAANPLLPQLEKTYRALAENMHGASCVSCHTPANTPGAERLVLLQTPLHAAGEIRRVIKSVQRGEMPQDEIGQPAEIDPKLRDAILRSAEAFRDELAAADAWETKRQAQTARAPATAVPAQPTAR